MLRLRNTNQLICRPAGTENKPGLLGLRYSGWGISRIMRWTATAARFECAAAEKAVPLSIIPSCLLDEGRAMPMLFWLPLIFASVLLEMNGFPPRKNNPYAFG